MRSIIFRFAILGTPTVAGFHEVIGISLSHEFTSLYEYLFIIPAFLISATLNFVFSTLNFIEAFKYGLLQAIATGFVFWFSLSKFTTFYPYPSAIKRALLGLFIGTGINYPIASILPDKSLMIIHDPVGDLAWVIAGAITSAICAVTIDSSTYELSCRNRNIEDKPNPIYVSLIFMFIFGFTNQFTNGKPVAVEPWQSLENLILIGLIYWWYQCDKKKHNYHFSIWFVVGLGLLSVTSIFIPISIIAPIPIYLLLSRGLKRGSKSLLFYLIYLLLALLCMYFGAKIAGR